LRCARFLARDIDNPGESYNEKLRFLKILEEIQLDHIKILEAMTMPPQPTSNLSGSISSTLLRRVPGLQSDHLRELAQQLTDWRLAELENTLGVNMTARGAEELHHYITSFGKEFLQYISQHQK
jgi:hypothetical protein